MQRTDFNGNLDYAVHIQQQFSQKPGDFIDIYAHIPDSFMYDVASQFEAPFAQGISGNSMIDTIVRLTTQTKWAAQAFTVQLWQGTADTELGLDIEFQAEADPINEVRVPILQLLKMVQPSLKRGNLITAPGPKVSSAVLDHLKEIGGDLRDFASSMLPAGITDTSQNTPDGANALRPDRQRNAFGAADSLVNQYLEDTISIQIGNLAFFKSVVITNVQKTYESQFDSQGLPHFARVSIRFKPLFMIVAEQLDEIFNPNPIGQQRNNGISGGGTR